METMSNTYSLEMGLYDHFSQPDSSPAASRLDNLSAGGAKRMAAPGRNSMTMATKVVSASTTSSMAEEEYHGFWRLSWWK
jgi:hypothetical protein